MDFRAVSNKKFRDWAMIRAQIIACLIILAVAPVMKWMGWLD